MCSPLVAHNLQACCSGELASALQQEIKYLADTYGGPTFPPHVTLVGGITGNEEHALKLATKLASKLKVC